MPHHSSTHTGRGARALLPLALLALTLALLPAAALAVTTIDIAAARALPLGSTVTIKGAITVPAGVFSSSTFDEGFALQDRSGGIYVSIATNLGLAPRQQVRVTGHLADNGFGLLILVVESPAAVKPLGTGPKVAPRPLATGEISEATEGLLVQVVGTITRPVSNDLPFGFEVFLDDGSGETKIFVCASAGIDVSGLAVGQTLQAIGFSGQFAAQYEVLPRTPSDLQVQ
jgi:uncharacterized protein YdeI (BOF family)